MKKVLISGTCGFLLGNYIRKAIYEQNQKRPQDKYTFVSVDRVTDNAINSMYWNHNHPFYPADVRDEHIIDIIFQREQPEYVIHGAAETSSSGSFITSNVLGTQVMIDACIKYKVKKLVYVSTDEVYGKLTGEQELPWTENSPIVPRSQLAASKACGELLVRAAHDAHGLIYNITRGANCYGPRQSPNKLIPKTIKCILEGQKIPVYGQGLQLREWTYVADFCSALTTILDKGTPNETYNISANQEFTNIEIVQEVCNAMGKGHNLIEFIKNTKEEDFRYAIDSSKIRKLGWEPQAKFKKDFNELCKTWYLDNTWWFK